MDNRSTGIYLGQSHQSTRVPTVRTCLLVFILVINPWVRPVNFKRLILRCMDICLRYHGSLRDQFGIATSGNSCDSLHNLIEFIVFVYILVLKKGNTIIQCKNWICTLHALMLAFLSSFKTIVFAYSFVLFLFFPCILFVFCLFSFVLLKPYSCISVVMEIVIHVLGTVSFSVMYGILFPSALCRLEWHAGDTVTLYGIFPMHFQLSFFNF